MLRSLDHGLNVLFSEPDGSERFALTPAGRMRGTFATRSYGQETVRALSRHLLHSPYVGFPFQSDTSPPTNFLLNPVCASSPTGKS